MSLLPDSTHTKFGFYENLKISGFELLHPNTKITQQCCNKCDESVAPDKFIETNEVSEVDEVGGLLANEPRQHSKCNVRKVKLTAIAVTTLILIAILTAYVLCYIFLMQNVISATNISIAHNKTSSVNGTCFVNRESWGARLMLCSYAELDLPITHIIISQTTTDPCYTQEACSLQTQLVQNYHMNSVAQFGYGYNFLIGGDGCVYVGCGWKTKAEHTKGYGIALIGTFKTELPTKEQLSAAKMLIEEGIMLGKIDSTYQVHDERQFYTAANTGEALVKLLKTWPHYMELI